MPVQSYYLDDDGQMYEDLGSETKKIFLKGQDQGTIALNIKYKNGKEDNLISYCSESTYLIEHL